MYDADLAVFSILQTVEVMHNVVCTMTFYQ